MFVQNIIRPIVEPVAFKNIRDDSGGSFDVLGRLEPEFWVNETSILDVAGDVYQRSDLSVNARNAVQGTTTRQPKLVVGGMNGLDVVSYDGTSDVLLLPNLGINGVAEATFFIVMRADSTTSAFDTPFCLGNNSEGRFEISSSGVISPQGLGKENNGTALSGNIFDTNILFTFRGSATQALSYINNVLYSNRASSGNYTTGAGSYGLGASNVPGRFLKYLEAEVLVTKKIITDATVQEYNASLVAKWGL